MGRGRMGVPTPQPATNPSGRAKLLRVKGLEEGMQPACNTMHGLGRGRWWVGMGSAGERPLNPKTLKPNPNPNPKPSPGPLGRVT
jgi:hypothetical protein